MQYIILSGYNLNAISGHLNNTLLLIIYSSLTPIVTDSVH